MNEIKLTIVCISYNQEKFIAQTIESVVKQNTSFPFQFIISDDCSTDGTAQIIKEYQQKYPNIINTIFHEKNLGAEKNYVTTLSLAKSKFVLINEGDDYLTDPFKLQKQVDFLEANPEFSICFHPVKVIYEDKSEEDAIFPTPKYRFNKTTLSLEDLLKRNFIQTNSVMYRWRFIDEDVRYVIPGNILPGDWFLHLLHAEKGKIGFIDEIMAVYRKHDGGIWNGAGKSNQWFLKCGIKHINCWNELEKRYQIKNDELKNEFATMTLLAALQEKSFDIIEKFSLTHQELYKKIIDNINFDEIAILRKKSKKNTKVIILMAILLIIFLFKNLSRG